MEQKKSQHEVMLALKGTDDVSGVKPSKLISNYPCGDEVAKKRKYLMSATYFVDSRKTGLTIGRFTNLLKAMKFLEKVNGILRPWQPTDEQMDVTQSIVRSEKSFVFTGPHRDLVETERPKTYKPFSKT